MSIIKEIHVPDIGDFKNVDVIEVTVAVGDIIDVDTPLIMLESDKATMEVPSPLLGVVREIKVKAGDKVSQGDLILYLDIAETVSEPERSSAAGETAASSTGKAREVRVPDIGDFKNVPIIEV
ncbi:MAG: biotin/lipoyl-binding protein, partial [Candidatus Competibacter sp.]|nr:biotin/lipoyl-binding protein [Candidatus Competibacter sp.]